MKKILPFLMLLLISGRSFGVDMTGATVPHVEYLFTDASQDMREAGTWLGKTAARKDDPNGGYLFRFSLQFEGSNQVFAFLGSDRFGDPKRGFVLWNVYQQKENGQWIEIARNVGLSVHVFYVNDATHTIFQYFPNGNISLLQIGSDGSVKQVGRVIPENELSEYGDAPAKGKEPGRPVLPNIEKIPFTAYLKFPDIQWRPYDRRHALDAQSLDKEDKGGLSKAGELTWKAAADMKQTLRKRAFKH